MSNNSLLPEHIRQNQIRFLFAYLLTFPRNASGIKLPISLSSTRHGPLLESTVEDYLVS